MPHLPGFRRASVSAEAPPAPTARAIRRALPPVGRLRRERRELLHDREERLRDLGGLMLEMFRRDQFRRELLLERCAELVALEERVAELDTLIAAAVSRGRVQPAVRCECGAPIFWGARFCGQCGRPVEGA
jgi:transposase